METTDATTVTEGMTRRTPTLFWIVAVLSLLWNLFGSYDYVMTRLRNMEYLSSMPGITADEVLAYIDSFPIWAQAGWGLGVWGAVAGSILLLLRSSHAIVAFGLSLVGMALSFGYQFFGPPAPPAMTEGTAAIIPLVIGVVGLAQFFYARSMRSKCVLR